MLRRELLFVALTLTLSVPAQTSGKALEKQLVPLTSDTLVKGWQTGDVLGSLIHAAFASKIPLGIVIEGDSLCRNKVPGSSGAIRLDSLIMQVQEKAPDYAVEIKNQALYVHPKAMRASTLDALELRIPRFTSEPSSAMDIGITLWMHIRGLLVPQESSMFAGGMQRNAELLPAINLVDLSVHGILDHVITLGRGGVWIMSEVPGDWQSDPKTDPYELASYLGDEASAHLVKCPVGDR